jgi:hypothetical protein
MLNLGFGLLLLLFGGGHATPAEAKRKAPEAQPLKDLPSGWTYLRRQGVDTWPGAYHDRISGAFVEFDLGTGIFTGWLSETAAQKQRLQCDDGQLGEVRFRRCRLPGQVCGSQQGAAAARYRLVVNFHTNSGPWTLWSFAANLCDGLQAKRVEELLFEKNRLWLESLDEARTDHVRYLSDRDLTDTKPGMDWREISDRLGPPAESERDAPDGFRVLYWIGGPETKQVWLVFDRGQKLVSK